MLFMCLLSRLEVMEKEMATHSSILVQRMPWTEEPDGLQSMRLQRVRHDWATHTHTHCSQRFQLSLRTSHPVQNRPRHPSPPSRGSLSSQGQPKRFTLLSSLQRPLDPGANHFTSSTSAPDQVQWTWCSVFLISKFKPLETDFGC